MLTQSTCCPSIYPLISHSCITCAFSDSWRRTCHGWTRAMNSEPWTLNKKHQGPTWFDAILALAALRFRRIVGVLFMWWRWTCAAEGSCATHVEFVKKQYNLLFHLQPELFSFHFQCQIISFKEKKNIMCRRCVQGKPLLTLNSLLHINLNLIRFKRNGKTVCKQVQGERSAHAHPNGRRKEEFEFMEKSLATHRHWTTSRIPE